MGKPLSKREFLKLLMLLPPSAYLAQPFFQTPTRLLQDPNAKNVVVLVFDALSAKHISLFGYRRETMPNLTRIAERATVYHNHYAGGNWTVPGTASLLTGTYPWTHRAFTDRDRRVIAGRESNNIFQLFDQYYRVGYSHNGNVNTFFNQFAASIDKIKKQSDLFIQNELSLDRFFPLDNDIAPIAWDRMMEEGEKAYTYSLFFAPYYQKYSQDIVKDLIAEFPRGLPDTGVDDHYLLEVGIDWLIAELNTIQSPFLGYFHFYPPHAPYNTRRDFFNVFRDDGDDPFAAKPRSLFSGGGRQGPLNLKYQRRQKQYYDEFILYADSQLGRLYDALEQSGRLENTWFVFTSDHGEMSDRGIVGHRTPVLYQPIVRVPLLILEPGRKTRRDIYSSTSAVDIVPTLLKVTGQPIPDWLEGTVLEPFSDTPIPADRSVYALEAKYSAANGDLNPATSMLVKDKHKLVYYVGYEQLAQSGPLFELYDLENDPEELQNIYDPNSPVSQQLKNELLQKLQQVNEPYLKR